METKLSINDILEIGIVAAVMIAPQPLFGIRVILHRREFSTRTYSLHLTAAALVILAILTVTAGWVLQNVRLAIAGLIAAVGVPLLREVLLRAAGRTEVEASWADSESDGA